VILITFEEEPRPIVGVTCVQAHAWWTREAWLEDDAEVSPAKEEQLSTPRRYGVGFSRLFDETIAAQAGFGGLEEPL
jgi:hypothetical protein